MGRVQKRARIAWNKVKENHMTKTGETSRIEKLVGTAPDISCGHCVAAIERRVGALDGVQEVHAVAETRAVVVYFDPSCVTRNVIEAALADEGYPLG